MRIRTLLGAIALLAIGLAVGVIASRTIDRATRRRALFTWTVATGASGPPAQPKPSARPEDRRAWAKDRPPEWPQGPPPRRPPGEQPGAALVVRDDFGGGGPAQERSEWAAAVITAANPRPAQRVEHFKWVADEGHTIYGWDGTVKSVERTPKGGYRVTIRVTPRLGQSSTWLDYFLEEYLIDDNGRVSFVQGITPADAQPGSLITD